MPAFLGFSRENVHLYLRAEDALKRRIPRRKKKVQRSIDMASPRTVCHYSQAIYTSTFDQD